MPVEGVVPDDEPGFTNLPGPGLLNLLLLNGADATYISGSIVELTAGQAPKGSVGYSTRS